MDFTSWDIVRTAMKYGKIKCLKPIPNSADYFFIFQNSFHRNKTIYDGAYELRFDKEGQLEFINISTSSLKECVTNKKLKFNNMPLSTEAEEEMHRIMNTNSKICTYLYDKNIKHIYLCLKSDGSKIEIGYIYINHTIKKKKSNCMTSIWRFIINHNKFALECQNRINDELNKAFSVYDLFQIKAKTELNIYESSFVEIKSKSNLCRIEFKMQNLKHFVCETTEYTEEDVKQEVDNVVNYCLNSEEWNHFLKKLIACYLGEKVLFTISDNIIFGKKDNDISIKYGKLLFHSSIQKKDLCDRVEACIEKHGGYENFEMLPDLDRYLSVSGLLEHLKRDFSDIKFTSSFSMNEIEPDNFPVPYDALVQTRSTVQNLTNKRSDLLLYGVDYSKLYDKKISAVIYPFQNGDVYIKDEFGDIQYNSSTGTIQYVKYTKIYEQLKEITNSKNVEKAIEAFQRVRIVLSKNNVSISLHKQGQMNKKKGILFGKAEVYLSLKSSPFPAIQDTVELGDCINDFASWENNLNTKVEEWLGSIKEKKAAYDKELDEEAEIICKDNLTLAVARFIFQNQNHITENAVIQAMRGTKIQLNTTIIHSEGMGKFNDCKKEEIADAVDYLIQNDVIYQQQKRGQYGTYYTLKLERNYKKEEFKTRIKKAVAKKQVLPEESITADTVLNDFQCYTLLKQNRKDDLQWYVSLMHCFDNATFLCVHHDEFEDAMRESPEEIKLLLSMKLETETDKFTKKILRQIVKK